MWVPKIIKTNSEHKAALEHLEGLMSRRSDADEHTLEDLRLVSKLIEEYENEQDQFSLPDSVSAIRFVMDQRNLHNKDLMSMIGSSGRVSEVLNGKRKLSLAMIRKLHAGLGIPTDILLQEPGVELPSSFSDIQWDRFPINEIVKAGWVSCDVATKVAREYAEELLRPMLEQVDFHLHQAYQLRQSIRSGSEMDAYALMAWKARIIIRAQELKNKEAFISGSIDMDFMREVAALSRFKKGPILACKLLFQRGVVLIIERHLKGTHLDGAATVMSDGRPVIGITCRYDRLDNFWFVLSHELAHLALHFNGNQNDWILDDLDSNGDSNLENEADAMAQESLIPAEIWKRINPRSTSSRQIREIAKLAKVGISVVAGRVRRESENYKEFTPLIGSKEVRVLFPDVAWQE